MKKTNGKIKKNALVATVCAAVMLTAAVLPVGGCSTCDHDVSVWETVRAATCTRVGQEKGVCSLCLYEVKRDIPVDENAHAYGEWEVSVPTETASGVAKKTCEHSRNHVTEVTIPALSSLEYTSEITKRPSALGDGERAYKYVHELGEITFTVPISASGIESVRDAVDIASSVESRKLIRSSKGTIGYEYHRPAIDNFNSVDEGLTTLPAVDEIHRHSYRYEFGNDYTHIALSTFDNTERWYARENGEVYGFAESPEGFIDEIGRGVPEAENYIDGFRFVLMYETGLGAFYGAENLLAGLYKAARLSENEDFEELVEEEDGETWYTFRFGHHDGNEDDGLFGNVSVSFTMSEEYTISYMVVESSVYTNNADMDDSANGRFDTWELVEVNGKKVARLKEGKKDNGSRYIDRITITEQVTVTEAADEPVPENPYPLNGSVYESFEVAYKGDVIGEGDVIDCTANAQVSLTLQNMKPQSAVNNGKDGFTYYYRDEKGNDHVIGYDTLSDVGVNVYNNRLRFQVAGEVQIVIKTARLEKVLTFNVAPIAPTEIFPTAFEYTRTGYFAHKMSTVEQTATVYAGQPLYFMAEPSALEINYTDASVTNEVVAGNANACTLVDEVAGADLPMSIRTTGAKVSSFVSDVPGVYTVQMKSTMNASVTCSLRVNVVEAPDIKDVLSGGSYMQELNYPVKGAVSVDFVEAEGYTKAIVSFNGRDTELKCVYDESTKTLTSELLSVPGLFDDVVYNFSLSLNEAYNLVLTHPTGFEVFTESAVLYRDVNSLLSGGYKGSFGEEDITLRFNKTNADKKLRAIIDYAGTEYTLICEYDIVTETLTSTVEKPEESEVTFAISFDEAYRLILTKTVAGESESITLVKI